MLRVVYYVGLVGILNADKNMQYVKDEILVIKLKTFKDANKLLTCFSKDRGKLDLIVKGASKSLSKLSSNLDTGNLVNINYYKSKGDIDLLINSNLINDFNKLKNDFLNNGTYIILYILEIINHFIQYEENNTSYFNLLKELLNLLNHNSNLSLQYLTYFQLKSLIIHGFNPEINNCIICDNKLIQNDNITVSNDNTLGYICGLHNDNINLNLINIKLLKVQKYLINKSLSEIGIINLSIKEWYELLNIQNSWLQSIIEKEIKSFKLLL